MKEQVRAETDRIIHLLKKDQHDDGSWGYPFETGVITDAYMIILLRTLEWNDEELIVALVQRLESQQGKNGAWKLFEDEGDGNLSLTVDAYYALLYSGYRQKSDPHMKKASLFIIRHGGLKQAKLYTKLMLAMTGQIPWPTFFPLPVEFMLLPLSFPINFYDISVFGRANLAPLMIIASQKFQLRSPRSPDLNNLLLTRQWDDLWEDVRSKEWVNFFSVIQKGFKTIIGIPEQLRSMAIDRAKQYMMERVEPDGTLLSYFSATFYMIFSQLALGTPKNDPTIKKAVEGLAAMGTMIGGHVHIQYTTANVWNTSLISHTLQRAGVPLEDEMVLKANQYLLTRQQTKYGDWVIHNQKAMPGGWGFSHVNTINPDVDDSTASLRSIMSGVHLDSSYHEAWERGIQWVHSMQNRDGGWPSFERGINSKLLSLIPIEGTEFLLLDPSTPDLTGRTLEFFGNYTEYEKPNQQLNKGVNWLYDHQEDDGSWYGRWGICYIYGTWSALTGLEAVGEDMRSEAVKKAVKWLKRIQNEDGGWGESCKSDIYKKYVPLSDSTLTHTAWAVDALIAASGKRSLQIENGIAYLIRNGQNQGWTERYPKGQGMAKTFYIHYHSYRYVWPLLAMANYERKFGGNH